MKTHKSTRIYSRVCGLQMLQAGDGDCFFLQLPYESDVFRMIIDCGTTKSWNDGLKPLLSKLSKQNIRINVLLITHIDSDHIGGAIQLFNDENLRGIVDEVWYNGLRHVIPKADSSPLSVPCHSVFTKMSTQYNITDDIRDGSISTTQSKILSNLIGETTTLWNRHSNGQAIFAATPAFIVAPGIQIDFLLPTESALRNLYKEFKVELNKIRMGTEVLLSTESERAFELAHCCELDTELFSQPISSEILNLDDITKWAKILPLSDKSITNASSIAFCLSYFGKQLLFTGDATSEDLVSALQRWKESTRKLLFFDFVKLPHHGSLRNCMELLDLIDGKHFLISTDGKKHGHPDKETLAKIVSRPTESVRHLIFNYETDTYRLFSNSEAEVEHNYSVRIQTNIIYF